MVSLEEEQRKITSFVNNTVNNICVDLDEIINATLNNFNNLSDNELSELILKLPLIIFNVSLEMEKIGTKSDVAKTVSKNVFSTVLASLTSGTVEYKRAVSNNEVAEMNLNHIAYQRAYKTLESKVQVCYELINSAKKVLSLRENERQGFINKVT